MPSLYKNLLSLKFEKGSSCLKSIKTFRKLGQIREVSIQDPL